MMRKITACLALIALVACAEPESEANQLISEYGEENHLPPSVRPSDGTLRLLEQRTLDGDPGAAAVVAEYYSWRSDIDIDERLRWYRAASEAGSQVGIKYYVITLNELGRCGEAETWRQRYFAEFGRVNPRTGGETLTATGICAEDAGAQ